MKILITLMSAALLTTASHSQSILSKAANIQWQRCLGGSGADVVDDSAPNIYVSEQKPLIATADGGYLLGGTVRSNDGDVSGNHGANDVWLVRLDQLGNTIWKKTFGGSANDIIGGIQETADHGFVVAGSSNSNNGDVSGNHGNYDAWVFRIDASGNLLWQKSVGGSATDKAYNLTIGPDNAIVVVGLTQSSNGDVSGLHKGADSTDAWVFKLDSAGALQWQKCLGGGSTDEGISIDITGDGGFIVGSNCLSTDGDVTGNHGRGDIWVVKLNSTGSISWQRSYGGTLKEYIGRIRKTADNGFIIAGLAESINGDVTPQPSNVSSPAVDGWILKINANGNPIWNKCYGDPIMEETIYDIIELPSGEFIVSGFANLASVSNYGWPADAWLFQLTATGTIVWMNAYGSIGSELGHTIVKSPDEGFLMLGTTEGDNVHAGYPDLHTDVKGSHGQSSDLWVVKFGRTNKISGTVFLDKNKNGLKEAEEPLLSGLKVRSVKGQVGVENITNGGAYINQVDTGSFVTAIVGGNYFDFVPVSKVSNFTNYNSTDVVHFAAQPQAGKRDLSISVVPMDVARPGFVIAYKIYYRNNGTDTVSTGQIRFIKDHRLDLVSTIPDRDEMNGDTLVWNYTNLKPFDTASITIKFRVKAPPAANLNDTLTSLALITPLVNDLAPNDDSAFLNQRVIGSYDPNDKTENLAGKISEREISTNAYIKYVIRFQNTGTDTAFNVTVRDTLDDKLDWSTLQMLAASHPYQLNIKSQNRLTWSFNNILLVDSNRNEPGSHGFIAYRIKPKSSLVIGDVIKNTASIYFDYNLPVETNTQKTEVVQYSINNPQIGIPSITSFIPVTAAAGETVTITGTNLTGAAAVSFGGVAASSFTVSSSTGITAVVGTGESGDISVTTAGGTATLAGFTFIPAPTITSFTPANGATGTSVIITGTNFTGATVVSFGGIAATSFVVNSATSITAVVASGTSGNVSVTTPGGIATLAGFTYIAAPTITSFTPTSTGSGTSVTITGTNFTGATGVSFGGTNATSFIVNSATSITAVVGTGASGTVSVTAPGGTATLAGFTYTVVTAIDPIPAGLMGIHFYPNPTSGSFTIDTLKLVDQWETLEILDARGKQRLLSVNVRNKTTVNVSLKHISSGLYIALLRRKNGRPTSIKFAKQ